MCGIAGLMKFHGGPVEPMELQRMTDALIHRGPDGHGHWYSSDGSVGLGHRRLAILDRSDAGSQPMVDAGGRYVLTYNGEIYNFIELRRELEANGHQFRGASDSEVILAAFVQWGEDMLPRFNGMWSFAIYDRLVRELFVARDRFGIKPFYYTSNATRFAFASELQALRKLDSHSELDVSVASRLLVDPMRVESSVRTLYTDILRLQAGCCARISSSGVRVKRWWNTMEHLPSVPSNAADQQERFRELFFDAVKLRMRSDVPIGTCLSGGFDSTAVTCVMAEIGKALPTRMPGSWRHAFVGSFPGWEFDERGKAEAAAAYSGISPQIVDITGRTATDHLERVITSLDDVYIDPGVNAWLVYAAARNAGVVVTLDGHGADELMGAYLPESVSAAFMLRSAAEAFSTHSASLRTSYGYLRRALHRLEGLDFLRNSPGRPLSLLGEDDQFPQHWGSLSRNLYVMFHSTILPTLLRNYDRLSMAHGVEIRMPFMDWRLVTYVMALPDHCKIQDGYSKRVARDALRGHMPESIRLNRSKIGFSTPMGDARFNGFSNWVRDVMSRKSPAFHSIVHEKNLVAALEKHIYSGNTNPVAFQKIWPYVNLKVLLLQASL